MKESRLFQLFCMVWCLLFILTCNAQAEDVPSDLTFGSQRVLERCWTSGELQGRLEDKVIVQNRYLLPSPPQIMVPLDALCPAGPCPKDSIRRVIPAGDERVVALTFDLCERADEVAGYDHEIVNYLRENKVRATFFAGGKWMQSHPDKTLQLMADPLFEIGNHTWTHGNLRVMSGRQMLGEILFPQAEYRDLRKRLECWPCARQAGMEEMKRIPEIPMVFRFPYGTCSREAMQTLERLHLPAIQWDVVTGDAAKGQCAEKIANTVREHVRPGSIIICHANGRGRQTAKASPLFVPELRKRGYIFVTVSQLLTFGPVYSTSECFELTPGDNKVYDTLFGEGTRRCTE